MNYTEEEIKKYLDILHNYKVEREEKVVSRIYKCKGCLNTESFSSYLGYNMCNECGVLNGHILGNIELKDFDRLHYQKKSIYHRKYYFDKKVKNISKLINITDEQKVELYNRLLKIDNYIMKILNNQYFRKRMININYVIKKILEEMGCENYKNIKFKISTQILEIYDKWWESYKELIK